MAEVRRARDQVKGWLLVVSLLAEEWSGRSWVDGTEGKGSRNQDCREDGRMGFKTLPAHARVLSKLQLAPSKFEL